jgi:hypothetical protein
MENCKEIMEQHLERAEACIKMFSETGRRMFTAASELERDMTVRMLKELSVTVSEELVEACMNGIAGRFQVNRAMVPFIAGAFGAARELVLTACAGEQSEEDLAKLSKVADEVTKMLVERSTVVTAKVKVEDDKPE